VLGFAPQLDLLLFKKKAGLKWFFPLYLSTFLKMTFHKKAVASPRLVVSTTALLDMDLIG
jgi:hypothetical protein